MEMALRVIVGVSFGIVGAAAFVGAKLYLSHARQLDRVELLLTVTVGLLGAGSLFLAHWVLSAVPYVALAGSAASGVVALLALYCVHQLAPLRRRRRWSALE